MEPPQTNPLKRKGQPVKVESIFVWPPMKRKIKQLKSRSRSREPPDRVTGVKTPLNGRHR